MIRSFRNAMTEDVFRGNRVKRVDQELLKKARRRLEFLNASKVIEDLYFPPSNRFHKLQGFHPSRYAIRVDDQWRITFEWHEGDAYNVCFEDYH